MNQTFIIIQSQFFTTSNKFQGDNFNLGVPGLAFNRTNVKVGDDGTKLVQIHQSQITPDQLETLQNNPNIKVCFCLYIMKLLILYLSFYVNVMSQNILINYFKFLFNLLPI